MNSKDMNNIAKKQLIEAINKGMIVKLYNQREGSMTANEFVEWYNQEYDASITLSSLFLWKRKEKFGGILKLIDKRGGYNKGETTIPDDAWKYFYIMYISSPKRGVKSCYDQTKKCYPSIPSIQAFYRKLRAIDPLKMFRDHATRRIRL